MAKKEVQLHIIQDEVLEREEELPKPRFSLDPLVQAAAYESTRKHYQVLLVLNCFCVAFGVVLFFVPQWFSYENVRIGLDRILLDTWTPLRSVDFSYCVSKVSSLVCSSLSRFYMAGIVVVAK